MCLLFFNVNDNCNSNELRLVLVNNRDEFWQRPTKVADFWTSNQSCIGGLDQEPGREGGTWLGASRQGRIACLVNISQQQDPTKKGRGFLVSDFLTKAESIESYTESIGSERDNYNGFILTLIELGQAGDKVTKVARVTNDELTNRPVVFSNPSSQDFFSVGNSRIDLRWRKVDEGERRFRKIVQTHGTKCSRDRLVEELMEMMGDTTRYLPDSILQTDGKACGWTQQSTDTKASLFVWDPDRQYGTRTTTVLTVDGDGNCDYVEKTLQLPVSGGTPQWSTARHRYTLQPAPLP